MPVIVTESLTRSYGARRGIEAVNLSIPEGVLYGFLGPNGAGKTTAIRVLLGFLRPTNGAAKVFGHDCWRRGSLIKRDVGYVPGDLRLYPWLNGWRALSMVGSIRGLDLRAAGKSLSEVFELDMRVKVRNMSRGMRQKLGLILAFAHNPRLMILDEPSSGLDPLMQSRLRDHLRETVRQGHTVFFSSHTLSEVDQLCDRVAIVRDGRIVADEPLELLRRQAGHDVTITWSGTPSAEPPAFLRLHRRDERVWSGSLEGPVQPLVRWLQGRAVEDLSIGRPDLESLFGRYYEQERAE